MKIELKVLSNIIAAKKNKEKIPSDISIRKIFETVDIEGPEEIITNKGKVIKKYCLIKVKGDYYKLNHTYDYVSKLISPVKIKGFNK